MTSRFPRETRGPHDLQVGRAIKRGFSRITAARCPHGGLRGRPHPGPGSEASCREGPSFLNETVDGLLGGRDGRPRGPVWWERRDRGGLREKPSPHRLRSLHSRCLVGQAHCWACRPQATATREKGRWAPSCCRPTPKPTSGCAGTPPVAAACQHFTSTQCGVAASLQGSLGMMGCKPCDLRRPEGDRITARSAQPSAARAGSVGVQGSPSTLGKICSPEVPSDSTRTSRDRDRGRSPAMWILCTPARGRRPLGRPASAGCVIMKLRRGCSGGRCAATRPGRVLSLHARVGFREPQAEV